MRVNRRRSNIEIIADMLKVGENGAGKTEIMYSANMSYSQIQKYLGYLLSQGFIDKVEVGNPWWKCWGRRAASRTNSSHSNCQ